MFRIGCHISSAGGYLAMAKRAEALGANTFAFFTRNPRGGSAKAIEETDIAAFHAECARAGIDRLVAHAPYTLNPCAAKPNVAEFARMAFSDDLQRMEHTPGQHYNFHPGSHVGQGIDAGIEKIAALLNEVLFPDMTTTVLLETMAGKGSEVGGASRSCAPSSTAWICASTSASASTRATSGTRGMTLPPTSRACSRSLTA